MSLSRVVVTTAPAAGAAAQLTRPEGWHRGGDGCKGNEAGMTDAACARQEGCG
jgi:hypothetical protein